MMKCWGNIEILIDAQQAGNLGLGLEENPLT
jgi:hypothetical protein